MPNWIYESLMSWDWSTFWPEVLGKASGVLLGIGLSWFLLIRRRLQSLGKLTSGDSDDILFQAHYLHRIDELNEDRVQLLFRNVAEKKTVEQIYDNPAAAELVRRLGDETELNQPILPTNGSIGFEILNDAAGWMSGAAATSGNPREVWLFCMTAEDRKVVRKRCVRCFLIRPNDLQQFHDWDWCRENVSVERPWHWFRVVALHRVARLYADQCRIYQTVGRADAMPLIDNQAGHRRIMSLSLGLISNEQPVSEPFFVPWGESKILDQLRDLRLEPGPWPDLESPGT
jgi:hypothetical protein